MGSMHDPDACREVSTGSLAAVVLIMMAGALAFTVVMAPLGARPGTGALPAAIHGVAAFLYLFVWTIALHPGWRRAHLHGDAAGVRPLRALRHAEEVGRRADRGALMLRDRIPPRRRRRDDPAARGRGASDRGAGGPLTKVQ